MCVGRHPGLQPRMGMESHSFPLPCTCSENNAIYLYQRTIFREVKIFEFSQSPENNHFSFSICFGFFFFFNFIYLFIYFWLCWVFVSVRGLPPVAASGGHSQSWCTGLSPSWPLLLQSTGSRRAGSVIVAHGPSCSAACGILPDQGSNPCPLHWQADSQPLRHQGSPLWFVFHF